uniref:Golgi apparatus membrane protein TVP23 homolog n=1 Tax=Steinernema glaseri TaxID=37863 RepID=A0A1I8AL29_9BILA
MASGFDSAPIFGDDTSSSSFRNFKSLRNPPIVVAHTGFRTAAILSYVFANLFFDSFIVQFLVILFLLSADFWFVKNVTGRLLVGLRWWNFVDGEGRNHWKFECSKEPERYDATERRIFWFALILGPALWFMLVVIAFLTFKWEWMVVAFLGFAMNGLNLYGYLRCKWNSTEELTNYLSRLAFVSMLTRSTNQPPPPHRPTEVA